jgi:hypothetical protein
MLTMISDAGWEIGCLRILEPVEDIEPARFQA